MKIPCCALLGAVVLATSLPAARAATEEAGFFQNIPFSAASTRAAAEKKLVFIDFYTTWCGPCKMLDQSTWKDPQVIAWMSEKTVALRLDAEKETELARRYAVRAYPTLLFLKPDGTEVDRLVGFRPAGPFLEAVQQLETGKNSLTRAREQVDRAATPDERVQARMNLGRELAQGGRSAEALEEFLWCFDTGMPAVPSYTGVRLSFLVSDLIRLGRTYPPALAALKERKERAWTAISQEPSGEGDIRDLSPSSALRQNAQDFVSLSRALKESEEMLRRYDTLPATDRRRRAMSRLLFEEFLNARRYEEAADAKPLRSVLRVLEDHPHQRGASAMTEQMLEARRRFRNRQMCEAVEVYAGAGRLDDARKVVEAAFATDASPEFRTALRAAAGRGGHAELVPEQPVPAAPAAAASSSAPTPAP